VKRGALKLQTLQRAYYTATATSYDEHLIADVEHERALEYMAAFIDLMNMGSLLDVGSGTGRVLMAIKAKHPGMRMVGLEPVRALIDQAIEKNGIPANMLICGDGRTLPFASESFDAVSAFGVLHHIAAPDAVVREMVRVSRRMICLSDYNRFGSAGIAAGWLKLALRSIGLFDVPTPNRRPRLLSLRR
jgi:ubiquinone/menaquinone biosynthesis C-methylase UbiE